MPWGEHRVSCLHCGKWFTCGDCIVHTCHECSMAGHSVREPFNCPACTRQRDEARAKAVTEAEARRLAETIVIDGERVPRHGWVVPLHDGARARCMGPPMCAVCRAEMAEQGAGFDPRRPVSLLQRWSLVRGRGGR